MHHGEVARSADPIMTAYPSCTVAVLSCSEPARLAALVERIGEQTVIPDKVLVIWNSPRPLGLPLPSKAAVHVLTIPPEDFGHGKTRNLALRSTQHEILVLITDDAWPADETWLAELLRPFVESPRVGAVFGRQIAADAGSPEAMFRAARYPAGSFPIQLAARRVFEIARTPASNANAAYRAGALRAAGGFREDLISGEDHAAAITLLDAGHGVWYAGDSCVVHSHRYGFSSQVRRTFDSAIGYRQLCTRLGLHMSHASAYGSLLRSIALASGRLSWRDRLGVATDISARVLGVMIARLSPLLPQPILCRVSRQRWFLAKSGRVRKRDALE